jgi:hypothetical protein
MTIETILPWVMSECGLDVSAPDISSNDYQMRQILALMNAAGKDINTRAEWSKATKAHTIAAAATSFSLPSDFQEMAGAGAITHVSSYGMFRPVTDESMWQFLSQNAPETPYYHIRSGVVYLTQAVATGGAQMIYISKNWLGTKSEITDNDDQPIFPDALLARGTIWRWRRQKGLPYEDLMAEFEADLEAAIQADRGAP